MQKKNFRTWMGFVKSHPLTGYCNPLWILPVQIHRQMKSEIEQPNRKWLDKARQEDIVGHPEATLYKR